LATYPHLNNRAQVDWTFIKGEEDTIKYWTSNRITLLQQLHLTNEIARAIVLTSDQCFLLSGTENFNTDGGLIIGQLLLHAVSTIL
jgi:hypothetical protein